MKIDHVLKVNGYFPKIQTHRIISQSDNNPSGSGHKRVKTINMADLIPHMIKDKSLTRYV